MNRTVKPIVERPAKDDQVPSESVTPGVETATLPIDGVTFYDKMKTRADFREIMERLAK